MVTLRATQKLLKHLAEETASGQPPDAGLGDWYANRIVIDRKPILIIVSSLSLLPILSPARDVRRLPSRLPDLVAQRLSRLGLTPELIEAERKATRPVEVGRTADRSLVGIMVDFARLAPFYLRSDGSDETSLRLAEKKLGETPCHAGRKFEETVFPQEKAKQILRAKWLHV